jgi:hypothetical protein
VKKLGRMKIDNNQVWNKLCALMMNDAGLAEGSMTLYNQALEDIIKTIEEVCPTKK